MTSTSSPSSRVSTVSCKAHHFRASVTRLKEHMGMMLILLLGLSALLGTSAVSRCLDPTGADYSCVVDVVGTMYLAYCDVTDEDVDSGDLAFCLDGAGRENIVSLYLQDNKLTTLPEDIFQELTALETLYLQDNELNALPPAIFRELTALETLYLGGNELVGLPPRIFDSLRTIETLYLTGNKLTTLPPGIFTTLQALTELCLLDNPDLKCLPTVPPTLTTLLVENGVGRCVSPCLDPEKVTYRCSPNGGRHYPGGDKLLRLSSCSITDEDIEAGYLQACLTDFGSMRISTLSLDGNTLTVLPPGVFDSLETLENLDLSYNALKMLPSRVFCSLRSLLRLDLSKNALTTLPPGSFDSVEDLIMLRLEFNQLTALPEGIFDSLHSLRNLRLWNNQLTTLPAGIFDSFGDPHCTVSPAELAEDASSGDIRLSAGPGKTRPGGQRAHDVPRRDLQICHESEICGSVRQQTEDAAYRDFRFSRGPHFPRPRRKQADDAACWDLRFSRSLGPTDPDREHADDAASGDLRFS